MSLTSLQRATNGHLPPVNGWQHELHALHHHTLGRLACKALGHRSESTSPAGHTYCTRCWHWHRG